MKFKGNILQNNNIVELYKKLFFTLPNTTPELKTYAIVDSLRDESIKEKIPASGLNHLDLWHEDLWKFELEAPLYLVELEKENAFTEYLFENIEKDLASYCISPYRIEALQRYYSFFTYPQIDEKCIEVYGRAEHPPEGKVWSNRVYFGFYDANVLPDFIQTLCTPNKIDEFFKGAVMWLVPNSEDEERLYLAFRDKRGQIDDVNLDLRPFMELNDPMLNFDAVSFPTTPDLESYAHEVTIDFKQMQMFEQRHKRKFIDNVFYWAKNEGYTFYHSEDTNRQRAFELFDEADSLGLESEEAVYRYIVYALLANTPMKESRIYHQLKQLPNEDTKVELLTQKIWKILLSKRRAGGAATTQ